MSSSTSIDDFGLTPVPEHQQQALYDVVCSRYERRATVITSNRDFNGWPLVFANPLMASATMDRLVYRAVKIVMKGKSYRRDSDMRLRIAKLTADQGSAAVQGRRFHGDAQRGNRRLAAGKLRPLLQSGARAPGGRSESTSRTSVSRRGTLPNRLTLPGFPHLRAGEIGTRRRAP